MHTSECRSHLSEDDALRSRYIFDLIRKSRLQQTKLTENCEQFPKTIVQFWHDAGNIPPDVWECLESWAPLEAVGYRRLLYDDEKARNFIINELGKRYAKAFERCHHPAMRCDYFRLCYLLVRGGFYVDADEFYQGGDCGPFFLDNKIKVQPLCYDIIKQCMVEINHVLNEDVHHETWIYYLNNNPIICPPDHPVIELALRRSTKKIMESIGRPEIQSTTGPGNLSASIVKYAIELEQSEMALQIEILTSWNNISVSKWPLSYRDDYRNWRNANGS